MKKIAYFFLLVALFGSFLVVNFAQAAEKIGVNQIKSGSVKSDSLNRLDAKPILRSPLLISPMAATDKTNVAQKKTDTIRLYFNNMVRKIQAAINREIKLADRIESRLNKLALAGKDVADLKVKLADVRTAISDAQKYLDDAKTQMETVLKSDNVKQAFQDVKTLIKNAVEKVKLAHQKLVDIVNSMKGMSGVVCKVASDCGKPLVCKDGKEYPAWVCNDSKCGKIAYFRDPCTSLPSASIAPSSKLEILTGNLTKKNDGSPSIDSLKGGSWYLSYEKGVAALSVKLIFDNSSICDGEKCSNAALNIGDRVRVEGIRNDDGFLVKTLNKLK